MSSRARPVALALGILVGGFPAGAHAERLAVLIAPATGREAGLADNLTEFAIAHLAEESGRELVGTLELRHRAGASGGRTLAACVQEPVCLGQLGVSLGVNQVITGLVRGEATRFMLTLSLTDVPTGRVHARFFKEVDTGLPHLLAALEEGLRDVMRPRPVPGWLRIESQPEGARVVLDERFLGTTPMVSGPIAPGDHRLRVELDRHFPWKSLVGIASGQEVVIRLDPSQLKPRRSWAPYFAYGTGAAAVVSLAAGGILGTLGGIEPMGQTRADAQADLSRRKTYARTGTALMVGGLALSAASIAVFVRHWRDIVGE